MKKILIAACFLSSCATYKNTQVNGRTVKKETANKKHMDKIHPYGFYAGGKYIDYRKNSVK